MAARAIGTATITFGMVAIPVKVYSSNVSGSGISFNLLERKTGARLKQQYVSTKSGEVVGRDEMVKGYEFAKGQYVLFSNEELKAVEAEANRAVQIKEFVPSAKVDPIFFDTAYYVGPDKGADRPYELLRAAMKQTGRAALAKYATRGKQYLVLLRPMDGAIVMQQLRYAHEIRGIDDIPLGDAELEKAELKLAVQLIEQIASEEFHPENYKDEVKERIEAAIQRKVEGQEVTAEPAEEPQAKIIDLMEALKASLASAEGAPAGEAKAAARKPAKRAPRKKAASKGRKSAQG